MRVLISGAGIAGLTVAYWLRRYGFTPTIVERAPSLLVGGYKIDIRGTAVQLLHKMNIHEAVVAASTDMRDALLVDKEGKVIHEMSGNEFGHRLGDDLEIERGKLCQILRDQVQDLEFIFDDAIQTITQGSSNVQVEFTNSSPREFDLVIGADGVHSNVRRIVFGEECQFAKELGLYLCVFTISNYLNLDRIEMEYSELGRFAGIWITRGAINAKAYFGFTGPSFPIDLRDRNQHLQVLKKRYEGIEWEIPKLLELMPNAPDYYFDRAALICMDHWSKDRVVLVGDAGYCPSPMSGQGTSVALIGAYILAGELAAAKGTHQTAFAQYEKEMRSFVEVNQTLGVRAAKLMKSKQKKNPFIFLVENIMKIAPGRLIEFFINRATKRINQAANSIVLKIINEFDRYL